MAEPEDMIVPLLREMRAESKSRFDRVHGRPDAVDLRLASMDAALVTFSQALGADGPMSKFVIGDFEDRREALEQRSGELEGAK